MLIGSFQCRDSPAPDIAGANELAVLFPSIPREARERRPLGGLSGASRVAGLKSSNPVCTVDIRLSRARGGAFSDKGFAMRAGIGYDIHRLEAGRKLVLGGVPIAFSKGLIGHSDGDVVLHAVADALLGAGGWPDLGEWFPDTDARYQGADSRALLAAVVERVRAGGWLPGNVDVIIHAEAPKLSAHKRAMAESVAGLLGLSVDRVSIKAKTNEGLGPIGAGEAIACTAVATLVSREE
jgi:2-C-methyl-D-erythritol 2,4-cyclodiphosphate synthase